MTRANVTSLSANPSRLYTAPLALDVNDVIVTIRKEDDGRYWIETVSTAALEDREGETFDVQAIDYDIAMAEATGAYPEFRVFHTKQLGIGRVEKMSRIGVFAHEGGHSYTDPFSLEVCEKMLANNDGRWRVSRGFLPIEVQGGCPRCNRTLVVKERGSFRCPGCFQRHRQYKGTLYSVRYMKARTFDITITDVPAVPYTGAAATRYNMEMKDMTKGDLRKRLLEAGITKEAVDARLAGVTAAQLKEFDDDEHFAQVLKELEDGAGDDEGTEEATAVEMDWPAMKKELLDGMTSRFKQMLNGFTIEVEEDPEAVNKQADELTQLKEMVSDLTDIVIELKEADDVRLARMLKQAPRAAAGRLKIHNHRRDVYKGDDPDDDDEDDEDDDEDMPPTKKKPIKKQGRFTEPVLRDAAGNEYESMTEFVS